MTKKIKLVSPYVHTHTHTYIHTNGKSRCLGRPGLDFDKKAYSSSWARGV